MALVTLQTIFQAAYPTYEQTHPLPGHVRRAARAIMQCRTAALGGHVQSCPDGHTTRIWQNACRHRSCPQCAFLQTERWLVLQQARLLACDSYHGIFTLPHDLHPLWLANGPVMSTLLLHAARDTLGTFLGDPKYLGAQPGIIAALHTWSQTLVLPPHLHGLVTGGGLSPAGHWVAVRQGFLLPMRVVMAVFRGKMLDAIRQAVACGEVVLPEAMRPQPFCNLLNRLGHPTKTRWNVRMMERDPHGAGVITSLARSLRGGPIKQSRLLAFEGARGTFRYRTSASRMAASSRMTLPVAAFLQRVLRHVPAPRTRVVRSYGLYHPTQAEPLAHRRALLGQAPVAVPARLDWQMVWAPWGAVPPKRCATCGQVLVCTGVIPRGGAPPRACSEQRAA